MGNDDYGRDDGPDDDSPRFPRFPAIKPYNPFKRLTKDPDDEKEWFPPDVPKFPKIKTYEPPKNLFPKPLDDKPDYGLPGKRKKPEDDPPPDDPPSAYDAMRREADKISKDNYLRQERDLLHMKHSQEKREFDEKEWKIREPEMKEETRLQSEVIYWHQVAKNHQRSLDRDDQIEASLAESEEKKWERKLDWTVEANEEAAAERLERLTSHQESERDDLEKKVKDDDD